MQNITTITAKELRVNFAKIRERVGQGETIDVIYRSRPIMRISPLNNFNTDYYSGSEVGKRLDKLLTNLPKYVTDPETDYKTLRDDMYDKNPKYSKYK